MTNPFIPKIGHSVPRAEAAAKVTGAEKYAVDIPGTQYLLNASTCLIICIV
ncbi:MAG: hypothetical protein ACOYOS_10520 [Syntrophales bacterium]